MATVNKDFKIKSGLIVEGTTASVNGFDILTKKQADQDYIVGLIGGTATSANTANTVVKRDADGNFAAGTITANVTGQVSSLANHDTADLAEGTNLYFTNARALSATSAAYDAAGAAAAAQSAAQTFATNADTAVRTAVTTEIGTAKTEAINAASADATSKANAAQTAAASDATTKAATAKSEAITAAAADATTKANAAETDANSYADSLIGDASVNGTAGNTVKARIDSAVANLVDGAPALLDTLNELALALGDSPDTITNLTTSIGEKLPKAGGIMSGEIAMGTNKITGLGTPTANTDASTKGYVDSAVSGATTAATTAADEAEAAANLYTDGEIEDALVVAQGYAGAAQLAAIDAAGLYADGVAEAAELAAKNYADALTTSDVAEGAEQYFTDARAKSSAAALLTGATLTNITITGSGTGLTITAENGVADSNTDNLSEGTTNKYFTAARAVTALEAVVPKFVAVELNSVAKQVAATVTAATAGIQTAHAFAKADFRSAEYLVKVAYGTHTEISKVLLTLDTSDNIAITEYGIVGTNGSASSISAGISGTDVQLLVTTVNNNSTVTVMGTLLK